MAAANGSMLEKIRERARAVAAAEDELDRRKSALTEAMREAREGDERASLRAIAEAAGTTHETVRAAVGEVKR